MIVAKGEERKDRPELYLEWMRSLGTQEKTSWYIIVFVCVGINKLTGYIW
uniref:Transmembrane protein n=1 Tax=Arabidopsis thaliana TaxID=3702 RepID=Q8GWB8_ARATH|nr:unknown protein [Arabidopsis thaliana]